MGGGGPPPPPRAPAAGGGGGAPKLPPGSDNRGDLMSAIRSFKGASTLKPAAERAVEADAVASDESGGGGDDLAAALRNALLSRKKDLRSGKPKGERESGVVRWYFIYNGYINLMQNLDSDEDEDESEDESDWEWFGHDDDDDLHFYSLQHLHEVVSMQNKLKINHTTAATTIIVVVVCCQGLPYTIKYIHQTSSIAAKVTHWFLESEAKPSLMRMIDWGIHIVDNVWYMANAFKMGCFKVEQTRRVHAKVGRFGWRDCGPDESKCTIAFFQWEERGVKIVIEVRSDPVLFYRAAYNFLRREIWRMIAARSWLMISSHIGSEREDGEHILFVKYKLRTLGSCLCFYSLESRQQWGYREE